MATDAQPHDAPHTPDPNQALINLVLKMMFDTPGQRPLRFDTEIVPHIAPPLTPLQADQLWHELITTEWVNPLAGFGEAGKLTLTGAGIQMMLTHGSYTGYVDYIKKHPTAKHTLHHIGGQGEPIAKPAQAKNKGK